MKEIIIIKLVFGMLCEYVSNEFSSIMDQPR